MIKNDLLVRWAAILSLLNTLLLGFLAMHRAIPLANIICTKINCGFLLSAAESITVPKAGVVTAALLVLLCLLAVKGGWPRLAALLVSVGSSAFCIYLIVFQVQVLGRLCVLCLVSSGLFFITCALLVLAVSLRKKASEKVSGKPALESAAKNM